MSNQISLFPITKKKQNYASSEQLGAYKRATTPDAATSAVATMGRVQHTRAHVVWNQRPVTFSASLHDYHFARGQRSRGAEGEISNGDPTVVGDEEGGKDVEENEGEGARLTQRTRVHE